MGTYGSRSLAVGGTAIVKASTRSSPRARRSPPTCWKPPTPTSSSRTAVQGGRHRQEGALRQVALTAYVPHNYPHDKLEPGLNENAFYDPTNFTYPAGSYICEVEVDPATGKSRASTVHRGATTSATSSTR
jgi:carbon-monoxide dehydrogenase large subunit